MEIVYMLGNGFDLNLGLKTSYKSFYEYYIKTGSKNEIINKFKNELNKNLDLWSDLEEALGVYSLNFIAKDKDKFIDLLEDIQDHLAIYISEQNLKLNVPNFNKNKFIEDLMTPTKYLDERDLVHFQNYISTKNINMNSSSISVITFNYTNSFEIITGWNGKRIILGKYSNDNRLKPLNLKNVIHIHGTTESNMILGVNDEEQISNVEICNDDELKESFVKSVMNYGTRTLRHERCVELLNSANIVCVFGMSFGKTDKCWWNLLIDNIRTKNQIVIIFDVAKKFSKLREYKFNRIKLNIKEKLLKHCSISEDEVSKIIDNIYVVLNSDMFKCEEILALKDSKIS